MKLTDKFLRENGFKRVRAGTYEHYFERSGASLRVSKWGSGEFFWEIVGDECGCGCRHTQRVAMPFHPQNELDAQWYIEAINGTTIKLMRNKPT